MGSVGTSIIGRPRPSPRQRRAGRTYLLDYEEPVFVEWFMGLPGGWVTGNAELTQNQQITALGNGVLPLQAAQALDLLEARSGSVQILHGRCTAK